ncbi:MAG: pyruvate kinase [Fimbriimonadia bacterium]|nr:pyruvate kinase [Fimbriimonadia bacterium]
MRRTKIVCTLGPAVASEEMIMSLAKSGMNVARINTAHGDWQTRNRWIAWVRNAEKEIGSPIGILLDLSGPKIRLGTIPDPFEAEEGQEFAFHPGDQASEAGLPLPVREVFEAARAGDRILLDDGSVELEIVQREEERITVRVLEGGTIRSNRGVTLIGRSLPLPSMTPKDEEDLLEGIEAGIDWIALSFVRSQTDIFNLRSRLRYHKLDIPIIAKIEQKEALNELDEIIKASDGIMVARGDLGVQVDLAEVPLLQKRIIDACNAQVKPVITATQMLESMMTNGRPTRAEVTDVANAIMDGTDAVMLSGETAVGQYPLQAVRWMARIAERAEQSLDYTRLLSKFQSLRDGTTTEAVAHAACSVAHTVKAKAILTATSSGGTPRWVSHFRPKPPILAATPHLSVYRRMSLFWGVHPMLLEPVYSTDEMTEAVLSAALQIKQVGNGDLVVLTAGVPVNVAGNTNLIQVIKIQ